MPLQVIFADTGAGAPMFFISLEGEASPALGQGFLARGPDDAAQLLAGASLLGGERKPDKGLGLVLRNAVARGIVQAQVILGYGVAGLGLCPKRGHVRGQGVVG